jgi:tetratricopeptide (TPR) repeat protein
MRTKIVLLTGTILLSSGLRISVAQQSGPCLAVLTEINGEAFLKKGSELEFSKAYWGAQLFQGDEIKTSGNSDVKLLFSNSNLINLGANSTMRISGKELPVTDKNSKIRNISSAALIDLSAFTLKNDNKDKVDALAGLRSAEVNQSFGLTSPNNSIIKTNRPSFAWEADSSFDNYTVNLYGSNGLLWSKKVKGSEMNFPDNEKNLNPGESYFWNVVGEGLIDNEKSANHKFSVISASKLKEVESGEAELKNIFREDQGGSSYHSVLGAFYISKGMLQDAINEFQIVSRININAPKVHEILASLYSDVGNKDKAIEELQKALKLTNNTDK